MTMAQKFLRGLLVVGGGLLLVMAAVILLAPRLLPGDLMTAQIIREVNQASGARITLGKAQLQWRWGWNVILPGGSLTGTGADLFKATGSATELESYDIMFEELRISPSLLPLFRKQLVVKAVELTGSRMVVVWKKDSFEASNYRLKISDLNLGLEPATLARPGDRGSGSTPVGDLIPTGLSFSFITTADTLILQHVPYTGIDLGGGFADKVLGVTEISAGRSTGTLTGNLTVDFGENPWGQLVFAAEATEVPASALLEVWAPDLARRLDCGLNTELSGSCDIRDQTTITQTLQLTGRVGGGPGLLHAADWLEDVTPYLGNRQDLKDVRFESLDHQFLYSQGRYFINGLSLSGGDTDWQGQGWVDQEGNLAVGVDLKLPPGFTPDLGNFSFLAQALRDADGRINLPLKLSGKSIRPTVGVDWGRLRAR
jgi:hypothetical protein